MGRVKKTDYGFPGDGGQTTGLLFRFVIALLLLGLSAGCAFVFLTAIGVLQLSDITTVSVGAARYSLDIDALTWLQRGGVAGGALVLGLIFLVLMFRNITPPRRVRGLHLLQSDERGFVLMESKGVATIAEHAALTVPGIVEVDVLVRGTGTSPVRLRMDVGVVPGAGIKSAAVEARDTVRDAVERLAGIDVKDVAVRAHVLEAEALSRILE